MPRKKSPKAENNIQVEYMGTELNDGTMVVTASVPDNMTP